LLSVITTINVPSKDVTNIG